MADTLLKALYDFAMNILANAVWFAILYCISKRSRH